jgi:hypothetical protein
MQAGSASVCIGLGITAAITLAVFGFFSGLGRPLASFAGD